QERPRGWRKCDRARWSCPSFGSETLAAALQLCQSWGKTIARDRIFAIPAAFPACQFALESALAALEKDPQASEPELAPWQFCHLLPAGAAALGAWEMGWSAGARTFKWKIGVAAPRTELQALQALLTALPTTAKLRLDANGGLDIATARTWLEACDRANGRIEFCEQLLPPCCFDDLQQLATHYRTPLALDESVATLQQLEACYARGWRGIYVIKAAIVGSPQRLRRFCQERALATVFSSVFEGEIGRQAALSLATELGSPHYALGFGTQHWLVPTAAF
ncbi:MAG: o-succinylbenzoate synthase, partial [Cyanobacteria bacterium J06641_5]